MTRKLIVIACLAALLTVYIVGCKKPETIEPGEPIKLVQPDTAITRKFPGDTLPVEVLFTTDRPINYVLGLYDVDSSQSSTYVPTYPDTLFYVPLDTLDPRVNIYTYTGSYYVPDTLNPYDVIHFRVSFEAGKSTFTTGQNYPAGKVSSTKEFKINVR